MNDWVRDRLLTALYTYVIHNIRFDELNATRTIIDTKLESVDSDVFLFCFSLLLDSNIFQLHDGAEHFDAFIKHNELNELYKTLSEFTRSSFASDININTQLVIINIIHHSSPDELRVAMTRLLDEKYRTLPSSVVCESFMAMLEHTTPIGFSLAIDALFKYNLLTLNNITLITRYPRPALLGRELPKLLNIITDPAEHQDILIRIVHSSSLSEIVNLYSGLNNSLNNSLRSFSERCAPFSWFSAPPANLSVNDLLTRINQEASEGAVELTPLSNHCP